MKKIEARNIYKRFQNLEVLKGIDLEVSEGEVVAVIGPSGGGKSTLLRCLNKLETIEKGSIIIDGETLAKDTGNGAEYASAEETRRIACKMGMVFQQFNLFPHMTVLENLIEAPVQVQKRNKEEVIKEAEILLEKVGLSEKRDVYPRKLSGGQQQRVAIARALAMKPAIML
ncbi:MAG: amino acid ABC transporter ATP-binding protein, partial [Phascolarctobacterium sp.]|nr:amino acid ABC transporter ATP-binding protein [Phascolarctobacterium sp.]